MLIYHTDYFDKLLSYIDAFLNSSQIVWQELTTFTMASRIWSATDQTLGWNGAGPLSLLSCAWWEIFEASAFVTLLFMSHQQQAHVTNELISRSKRFKRPFLYVFVSQGCFIFSLVKYKPLTYNKVYEYPDWAIGLGWFLALSSMICIPMVMVIKILQSEGPLIEVSCPRLLVFDKLVLSFQKSAQVLWKH